MQMSLELLCGRSVEKQSEVTLFQVPVLRLSGVLMLPVTSFFFYYSSRNVQQDAGSSLPSTL